MTGNDSGSNIETEQKPRRGRIGRVLFSPLVKTLCKALLAGAIIAFLIHKAPTGFVETLRGINPLWIAGALLLYALHIFANAWRWWILLRVQNIDCPLSLAVSLTMQSFFFSLVLPGAIGGDLVRAGFLAAHIEKGRKFDGAFTILIDRFTGMIGIFLVALLMLPFVWESIAGVSGIIETFIRILLAGSVCGILAAFVVFGHKKLEKFRLYRAMKALADRFSGGLFSRISDALDSYNHCRMEIFLCIVTSVVFVNLVLALMAYCVALGVNGPETRFGPTLAAITVGNIAGLLPTTPAGLGVRDMFVIPILKSGGMNGDAALAVSLVISTIIVGFNLLGGLFFIFTPISRKKGNGECSSRIH